MEKTKQLTMTSLMVALSVVLSLIIYFLPILQGLMFVISVPLMYIGIQYNIKIHSLGTLAFLLIMMMLDPLYALMILCLVAPLSLIQGFLIKHRKKTSEVIFIGAMGSIFGLLGYVYLTDLVFHLNMIEMLKDMMDEAIAQVGSFYNKMGIENTETSDYLSMLNQMKDYFVMLMPALVAYFALVSSALSYFFANIIFKRFKVNMPKGKFKDFRMDTHKRFYLVVIMVVVTAAAFIDKENTNFYASNFMSILFILLQINGLALVWYITDQHPNRKALRIITIVLYIIAPIVSILDLIIRYGLVAVGFFDMYADFRNKIKRL
ncbi:MAG: DUF2232 domain-containing protein [Clostridia bacterium]|nr:DUF2232 domain-containing protein [Clostridia bacterium]